MMKRRNFRKRSIVDDGEENSSAKDNNESDDEQERRLALEEVKFLQKQRERKLGVPAISSTTSQVTAGGGGNSSSGGLVRKVNDKGEGDGEKDELVLQDTFAQETAVMEEDPNMLYLYSENGKNLGSSIYLIVKLTLVSLFNEFALKASKDIYGFVPSLLVCDKTSRAENKLISCYSLDVRKVLSGAAIGVFSLISLDISISTESYVNARLLGDGLQSRRLRYVEQELAKKRGKNVDVADQVENEVKRAEDELYKIPEHLKVKRRNSEESSTQWTTGIAEIQLPIEYKLKNIEETEAAKKLLQEKRLMGRAKTESSIPSSYSADYFQRGKDYAEKLRRGKVAIASCNEVCRVA
ncbi:putative myricetin O-methyltransferase-like [Capsicum annuum]|nr:putative myricetin O-methyltransferase-like [Capsicum annuum]